MSVDFGRTARDYAAYRAGFPDALFSRLGELNVGIERQRVVDLGTGTGALARGFAHRGCVVTGLDPAPAMLEQARRLDAEAGVQVSYREGRAEDTGLQRAVGMWFAPGNAGTGSIAREPRMRPAGCSWPAARSSSATWTTYRWRETCAPQPRR